MSASNFGKKQRMMTRAMRSVSVNAIANINNNVRSAVRANSQPVVNNSADASMSVVNWNPVIRLNRVVSVDDLSQSQNNTRRRAIRTISADAILEENISIEHIQPVPVVNNSNSFSQNIIRTISAEAIHEENENGIANELDDAVPVQDNTVIRVNHVVSVDDELQSQNNTRRN